MGPAGFAADEIASLRPNLLIGKSKAARYTRI